ncbi:hypothetical protein GCM10010273_40360 [Streptomyces lavendulocolor]
MTGRTDQEADQPDDQHDGRHPPENLESETRAEKNQGEKKNEKKRDHDYQPPSQLVPGIKKITQQKSFFLTGFVVRILRQDGQVIP